MHFLIVCSHTAVKVRWSGEQGQAAAVTIFSFLGTFWWCVRIGKVVVKL